MLAVPIPASVPSRNKVVISTGGRDLSSILKTKISHFVRNDIMGLSQFGTSFAGANLESLVGSNYEGNLLCSLS